MSILRSLSLLLIVVSLSFNYTPESGAYHYINQYRDLAVVEMYRSGVPASITLAQALHETNYGTSKLATIAKNHFGIKCKSNWFGETYFHKDDDLDRQGNLIKSCFRSYDIDIDSYIDHSNFLMSRSHYANLFQYHHTDYQNWAYGLKSSGYATDPRYAEKLISKIERYGLDQYDHWENPLKK
jgi:flagellum-specific peptidoglycan hydrolase FlgJ